MSLSLRVGGLPSAIEAGAHLAGIARLPEPMPAPAEASQLSDLGQAVAGTIAAAPESSPTSGAVAAASAAIFGHGALARQAPSWDSDMDIGGEAPAWLGATAKLIRPLCVGALMAIPTLGAASIGVVAIASRETALAMAEASTRFLSGIPAEIVTLIGFLAGGYTLARSAEKIVGQRR